MRIQKSFLAGNGANTTVHKLWNVEITNGRLYAIVDSYVDDINPAIVWRDRYLLPSLTLGEEDVYQDIINTLINTPGPFFQGNIIE